MGWEDDPELGLPGQAKPCEASVEQPSRQRPMLISPAMQTAQSMAQLAKASKDSKPAYVGLPCFTC